MRLENQRALVTGGATGIGEAIVRLFAAEGASVLVADLNEEKGQALAAELDAFSPGRVVFRKTNVASSESYQAAIATAAEAFGGLDVLVNNAGIVEQDVLIEDQAVEEWDRVMGVNLHGPFSAANMPCPIFGRARAVS